MQERSYRRGMLLMVALHLLVVALYAFEVIPQAYKAEGRVFWFHHGGDDYGYVDQARAMVTGEWTANKYPLGYPLTLLPFMAALGTTAHNALLEPVSAFWALVLFPVGQLLLGWLTWRATAQRWAALLAVALLTVMPLVLYGALALAWNREMAELTSVHLFWGQMLSDGPAAFFTLVAIALAIVARDRGYPAAWVVVLGLLLGYLVMLRLTLFVVPLGVAIGLLVDRQPRALAILLAASFIGFLPQVIYNTHFFGAPWVTGYTVLDTLPPDGLFHPGYLVEAFGKAWSYLGLGLVPLLGAGLFVLVVGTRVVARSAPALAWFIVVPVIGHLALYAFYYYTWTGAAVRFMIPILPLAMLLTAATATGLASPRITAGKAGGEQRG
jgi:hypothetical protein